MKNDSKDHSDTIDVMEYALITGFLALAIAFAFPILQWVAIDVIGHLFLGKLVPR